MTTTTDDRLNRAREMGTEMDRLRATHDRIAKRRRALLERLQRIDKVSYSQLANVLGMSRSNVQDLIEAARREATENLARRREAQ